MVTLKIGNICEVQTGIYAGQRVEIIDLPDEHDARYSVSIDGRAGYRFHAFNLCLLETEKEQRDANLR